MQSRITYLSMLYVLFLILLFISGALPGALSLTVYFLSFIIPVAIGLYLVRKDDEPPTVFLTIDKENVKKSLPIIMPTVAITILISYITSLVIFIVTGKLNSVDVGDRLIPALISHALLPAILEEALFRYLPLRLLAPRSRRGAVLISAFFFALVHRDLFQIPYAFMAGVILMAIDIATDSVIPSVLIHFINNAISVGMMVYSDNRAFTPTVYAIIGILTVISLIVIIVKRKTYRAMLQDAFEEGVRYRITIDMICFAFLTLVIAVFNLILNN